MSELSRSTSKIFRSAGLRHCRCSRRRSPSPEVAPFLPPTGAPDPAPLTPARGAALPRLHTSPAALSRSHVLDPHLASPRRARALFRRACMDWALGNAYDHAALVVNELVTNAVRHARTTCRLNIRLDALGLRV